MSVAARPTVQAWREATARERSDWPGASMPDEGLDQRVEARAARATVTDRVLLVAATFQLPYRVLRCARASRAEVYVLGSAGAAALRCSRYCERFVASGSIISGERDEALALEINCLVREYGIGTVVPGDALSTRSLIASRDLIKAPCFPLPALEAFDLLNNKWAFAGLCHKLDILHPETQLVPDAATLAQAVKSASTRTPLVAKPLSRSGGVGFLRFDGIDTECRLHAVNYQPILLQELVEGADIGASVYANAGEIEAFIAHSYRRRTYRAFAHDQIYSDIGKIAAHCRLTGVYNFDMIMTPSGSIYYLECNPRFFFKINLSMIAGINFVECGLPHLRRSGSVQTPTAIQSEVRVRYPEALLLSLMRSRPTLKDWRMAAYLYADPWPYLIEKLNLAI